MSSTSGVTVNGGILGGTGTINAPVLAIGGAVKGGDSPGILTTTGGTGTVSLNSAASFNVDITGAGPNPVAGTDYSQVVTSGVVNLNNDAGLGSTLNVNLSSNPVLGAQYTIISSPGNPIVTTFQTRELRTPNWLGLVLTSVWTAM